MACPFCFVQDKNFTRTLLFFANVIQGDSEQNTNTGEYCRGKWIIANTVSRHVDGTTV